MRQTAKILLAAIALSAPMLATGTDDRVYGGVYGLYLEPDEARDADYAYGGGLLLGRPVTDWLGVEINAMAYSQRQEVDPDLYDRGAGIGVDLVVSNWSWRKRPFLTVGAGFLYEEIQLVDYGSGYLNLGAGLTMPISSHGLALRAELRGMLIFNDRAIANEDSLLDAHARVGLVYPFGAPPQVSAVGPAPVVTEPPRAVSTTPLFDAGSDRDGDGVPDHSDACAGTGPGVAVDFRGCSADTDRDGVTDDLDACPNTLAQFNVDERGCAILQSVVLEQINFEVNSAKLDYNARTLLAELGACLVGQPSMQLEIAGHSDNLGSQAENLLISQQRAQAVLDYLVRYGIPAARLRAEGYGEFQPVGDNATEDGRALNRRVEIRAIP